MKYFKLASIFLIIELMIVFIVSLLNLIGLNGGISSIILLILNIILFFILTFYSGKNSNEKGYLVWYQFDGLFEEYTFFDYLATHYYNYLSSSLSNLTFIEFA